MKARRFNESGLEKFGHFLDSLTTDTPEMWPKELLDSPDDTDLVVGIEVEDRTFPNRFEIAKYLYERLAQARGLDRDTGLWSWLALFYFKQLCKKDMNGAYKPGARALWIPEARDFRRYYRHLLAGPYFVYRAHSENPARAFGILAGELDTPGEVYEQIVARQELVSIGAVVETATKLYFNPDTKTIKKGAAGKGGGSARRLADILNQFDVTWDLATMESDDILNMLPREFDKFRQ
jgi:hypothetical protein